MLCSRKSLLPILIVSALLLIAARSARAESGKTRPNQHKGGPNKQTDIAQQNQPEPTVPLAVYASSQAALLEALRTIRTQQEAAGKQNSAQYEPWYAPAVLAQFGLIIIGVFYTKYAWKQWTAIRAQAQTADQELIIANRAYLYLSEVRITFLEPQNIESEDTEYRYVITYPIYNGGQTPALYMGAYARTTVEGVPPKSTSQAALALDRPQNAIVPPRAHQPLNGQYDSFLSQAELMDIRGGKRKLFFYGMLTYSDVFGKEERHTWFTLSFSGTPAEVGKSRNMVFETAKGLNRFD